MSTSPPSSPRKKSEPHASASSRCATTAHGTVQGRFALPGLNADMLAAALNAIASPKRPDAIDRDGRHRRGQSEADGGGARSGVL